MKRMTPEARVGLLVLTALLLLVYMSLKVGKLGLGMGGGYRVSVRLDNAAGLVREAEVLVAGIPVGFVDEITLEGGRARIVLRIHSDVVLPVDSVASVRTHGVLGDKYLEVVPGMSKKTVGDGDALGVGPPPGDLDQLVTSLNAISADVKRVTGTLADVLGTPEGEDDLRDLIKGLRDTAVGLRAVVSENRAGLRETIVNLRVLTAQINDLVAVNRPALEETLENARSLTRTLADRAPAVADGFTQLTEALRAVVDENREDLRVSMVNLRGATGKLSDTLDVVRGVADGFGAEGGTLGRLIHDDSLYEDLQGALGDLRAVLGRVERGEGTLGKLLNDDTVYSELASGLQNLNSITEKIDRGEGTIGKLVNDPSVHDNLNETLEGVGDFVAGANRFRFELGYRGEYLTGLGEWKSYAHLTLQPRQDRFYYIALVDDPRGLEQTETTERVIDDNGTQRTVTEVKTTTKDRFKFSAQVGKRFSYLTLRGGLVESSAGVAADVDLWSQRLRLTFEAYDFARADHPVHLKATARWSFMKFFYATGGLDDFLDDKGRADYFMGAGIRFEDQDLKYLFSPLLSAAN